MSFLVVNNVTKKGPGDFELRNVSFSQKKLERVAVAGETGAGKSTLLKLIAGLVQPDSGEIVFEKVAIKGPAEQLVPGHPGIAYLSQHFDLQKSLRVEQVLAYANKLTETEATRLYKVCQIDHLLVRRTDELSGGEKQRVAICRLLISRPRLLLLDEPFSHLDMVHKTTLKSVIRDIGEKLRITCMLVSHDPYDTLSWADSIIVMRDGLVIQKAAPQVIYDEPVDEYTGGLFGKYNLIRPDEFKQFSVLKPVKALIAKSLGKNIFIRPEQFKIGRKTKSSLRGKVESISYFGNSGEANVAVSKKLLTVRVLRNDIQEGQIVYLTVSRGGLWSV